MQVVDMKLKISINQKKIHISALPSVCFLFVHAPLVYFYIQLLLLFLLSLNLITSLSTKFIQYLSSYIFKNLFDIQGQLKIKTLKRKVGHGVTRMTNSKSSFLTWSIQSSKPSISSFFLIFLGKKIAESRFQNLISNFWGGEN